MAAYTYVNGIRITSLFNIQNREEGYYVRKDDTEVFCTDFDEALKLANIIAFHKDMLYKEREKAFLTSVIRKSEESS